MVLMGMKLFVVAVAVIALLLALIPNVFYGIARILSALWHSPVKYKPFAIASVAVAAVWIMAAAYGHFRGRFQSRQTDVTLRFPGLPPGFDGYRIVQISDLHLDGWEGHDGELETIVRKVNSLNADAVFFTGDIVSLTDEELPHFLPILSKIKAKDGIFSILGNHDYLPYDRRMTDRERHKRLQNVISMERDDLHWRLLMNGNAMLKRGNDSIAILGSENQSLAMHSVIRRGDLAKTLQGTDGMFRILLTHDPSHWRGEVLGKHDIPLTLSGHTHGGQVGFFGRYYLSGLLYKEHAGLYREGNQCLYVNTGIGGTMPMRIGDPAEITVITLKK